ncbi:hypothetical protein V502_01413 [Pseudogymnoascus sp. VKM F-4520 (FW-2644)]|nr:hypothetical protein V502_01413 [Pseudogymnoascus sp. VKM F-4520 (FW-2644)]
MRSNSLLLLGLAPANVLGAILYATHYSGTLSVLSLSDSSLTVVSSEKNCGPAPSWVTFDSANQVLYCVDELNQGGSLNAFNADAEGGLTPIASAKLLGNPVHSALYGGEDGISFQAFAHYSGNLISTIALPITNDSQTLQSFSYTMDGPGPDPSRQEAPHPHMAAVDPTGGFIIVPDLGADLLRVYSVDKPTGFLTSCANVTATPGSGPRHVAFWEGAGGTMMYLANELGNDVTVYSVAYPSAEGECLGLISIQTDTPYPADQEVKDGQKIGEVRVSGNTVTVSNRADESFGTNNDSIAVFAIDASGAISTPAMSPTYGSYPRTMQINAAGDLVAIGNQNSGTVVVVSRDPATGALGDEVASVSVGPEGVDGVGGLSSVAWAE